MSRIVCYLFACTMVLTTVVGIRFTLGGPQMGIAAQCMSRGNYAGACKSHNEYDGELRCLTLMCAVLEADGSYRAENAGPVDDDTLCGYNKVCEESVCVSKHPSRIAESLGNEPRFDCNPLPDVEIPPYPPGFPKGRSPQLVVPAPHLPWQMDPSSSDESSVSSSGRSSPHSSDR